MGEVKDNRCPEFFPEILVFVQDIGRGHGTQINKEIKKVDDNDLLII
jgi:hypothetical protein